MLLMAVINGKFNGREFYRFLLGLFYTILTHPNGISASVIEFPVIGLKLNFKENMIFTRLIHKKVKFTIQNISR